MKKIYLEPQLNTIVFDDFITTSGEDWNNSGGNVKPGDTGWSDDY